MLIISLTGQTKIIGMEIAMLAWNSPQSILNHLKHSSASALNLTMYNSSVRTSISKMVWDSVIQYMLLMVQKLSLMQRLMVHMSMLLLLQPSFSFICLLSIQLEINLMLSKCILLLQSYLMGLLIQLSTNPKLKKRLHSQINNLKMKLITKWILLFMPFWDSYFRLMKMLIKIW